MKKFLLLAVALLVVFSCATDGDNARFLATDSEFVKVFCVDAAHSVAVDTLGKVWFLHHGNFLNSEITSRDLIYQGKCAPGK